MKLKASLLAICLLSLLAAICFQASAQQPPDGGGRGGGGFDPAQFRQRMMDGIKESLGASDEEWKALSPKVEKVMSAQRDGRSGGGGGFFGGGGGGRGGRGGPGGAGGGGDTNRDGREQSAVSKASS